ncbi:TRAP transporter substrate-binding protein [Pseudorhizobium banfieldiae]|nr:TRAP transporter substrate-binding protein [Pseudorhizobium banfieldiae]
MIASVAALALTTVASAQEVSIKFGFSSTADLENDNGAAALLFKNYVESHTDDISVEVHGSSALGSDADVIQALQLGSGATMHIGGTATYNTFIPKVGVLDLPFLWKDYAHVASVLDGDVGNALQADFEGSGFKVLGYGFSWGYRNVITRGKAINEPDHVTGLKIRTIQSPIYVAALNAMGANATPMSFNEVYTALQTGVLDGFEHAASMAYSAKLYEVSDHLALTRHLFGPTVMTYSLNLWNQLSPEQQALVQEAADFSLTVARAMAAGKEQEALQKLAAEGMTITDVDTTKFVEAAQPLQEQLASDIGATDLLTQIRSEK